MGRSRRKDEYTDNASKLHQAVGKLIQSIFPAFRIYQEYPVRNIDPNYHSGKERYDWAILELKLVIEAHGKQHFEPVCFGGIPEAEAEQNFILQQKRDNAKRLAAEAAGWRYISIAYNEPVTEEFLLSKFVELGPAAETQEVPQLPVRTQRVEREEDPEKRKQRLDKAREYRKKFYRRMKELRRQK